MALGPPATQICHDREMADDALRVTRTVRIPRSDITTRFSTSGGPGGQHANKAQTRVEMSFDVAASRALTAAQRRRIIERIGPVVRVTAEDERSQVRNRALAEERLIRRLADALRVQPKRRPTRPTRGSQRRRLEAKRHRSDIKAKRRRPRFDD